MKIIIANSKTHGKKEILVSDCDYEELSKYKWAVSANKRVNGELFFYAMRGVLDKNGKFRHTKMHRVILGITDKSILCDHKDGNTLNNQRENLRMCSKKENNANRIKRSVTNSKYKGVYKMSKTKTLKNGEIKTYTFWAVSLTSNKKQIYIGTFKNEEDAARAYDEAAIKYHGEFANLNLK